MATARSIVVRTLVVVKRLFNGFVQGGVRKLVVYSDALSLSAVATSAAVPSISTAIYVRWGAA